jgi:hypothetical protein
MSEFEFIGQGHDHLVYRSPYNPTRFFKKPRFINNLTLFLSGMKVEDIQKELDQAQSLLESTPIKIPNTRIVKKGAGFRIFQSYRMFQDQVIEDQSIPDMEETIRLTGISLMIDKYWEDPRNFKSSGGHIYWIDPTRGSVSRSITRWFGISHEENVRRRVGFKRWWKNYLEF